ncbi:MAG: c-type cytochrome biogenesis protein CcsB [Desulfobacterales bacterium]|jgi:cytochrome c-type biogenesis protein CcsB
MEIVFILTILLYLTSAAGYLAFLYLQKKLLHRFGYFLLLAGFMCHTATIIYAFVSSGHMPVSNMHETLSLAAWTIAGMFLVTQYKFNIRILGIVAAPLVTLIMIVTTLLTNEPSQTANLYKNFWLIAHVVVIFIGEASFALACGLGVLYLIQENSIKTKKHRFFFKRLPSLDLLDSAGYVCIVVGFTMLTLGLITGFVYAKSIWGRFWSWDPKEVWSGITWLFYAALLHERLIVGWRGRRSAIMAIIGFGVLLFTFLGVNLLLEGHHKDFTKI